MKLYEVLENRLVSINANKPMFRVDKFVLAVYELLAKIRRELFVFGNVQPLLEGKVLRPASEHAIEPLKLNFLCYFFNNFGPHFARLLGLVCKLSDLPVFKSAIL